MPPDEKNKGKEQENRDKKRGDTDVHPFLRIALFVSILALATYLFFHFGLHTYFIDRERAVALVKSFGPLSVLIFTLLQVLQVLIAPVPGEATGFIGGYLYGPVMGTIYSTIGLTIGSWLAFALSRWLGLPFVEKVVDRKILQKYDRFMEHQGALVTFAMFLIPGFPKDALCYIMGLSHMRTSLFLLVSTAGRLFGTILLSVGGSCVRNAQTKTLFAILAFTAVVLVLAYLYRDELLKLLGKKQPPRDSGKAGPDTPPDKSPDKSMDK